MPGNVMVAAISGGGMSLISASRRARGQSNAQIDSALGLASSWHYALRSGERSRLGCSGSEAFGSQSVSTRPRILGKDGRSGAAKRREPRTT
jgi:hypothetical protein